MSELTQRWCPSCKANLARDGRRRVCSPCEKSHRGKKDDRSVVEFALGLRELRARLGVLGLDYVFFHHFLNETLQRELQRLRQQLYRQETPPRPLGIADAGRWLSEELASTKSERISLTFEPEHYLLWRAFDEPRWSRQFGEHIHGVLARLAELGAELLPAPYTLHLALVCGTPPLPVGLRVSTIPLPLNAGIVFEIFSAKERSLRHAYGDALAGSRTFSRGASQTVEARWVADRTLPFLQLAVVPGRDGFPSPASVERVFRRARSPVDRFYDGNTRARDYVYALRSWALYLLVARRRMSQREALDFWNRHAPAELRYNFDRRGGPTQPVEGQLSQEFGLIRSRIARFTS